MSWLLSQPAEQVGLEARELLGGEFQVTINLQGELYQIIGT
jgi:hypothetical protein